MSLRGNKRLANVALDESGQAATEYALVAFWTVILVIASIEALRLALFDYYQDVVSLICLPVP